MLIQAWKLRKPLALLNFARVPLEQVPAGFDLAVEGNYMKLVAYFLNSGQERFEAF